MDNYEIAKECFEDIIDKDMLIAMKRSKLIECVEGFKCGSIAMIELAIDEVIEKNAINK